MSQFCISCGIENSDEAKFCKSCGKNLNTEEHKQFDKKTNYNSSTTQSSNSNTNQNFGSKLLKYILAIIVAIIIFTIASVIFQLMKGGLDEVGQSIYDNYGRVGTFIFVIFKMLPLIIGVWLVKISWKKITN